MNKELLKKHILAFFKKLKNNPDKYRDDKIERDNHIKYYQSFTPEQIKMMNEEDMYEYLSKLWAMLMWGNKKYQINKIINENGFENLKQNLANLLWGKSEISLRWDNFRKEIKHAGPAMISEILCKTHPNDYMIWNKKASIALNYIGVKNIPRHNYQINGQVYEKMCKIIKSILKEFNKYNPNNDLFENSLLFVDYFFWDELQVVPIIPPLPTNKENEPEADEITFLHNEIRDKLCDIGEWLGFQSKTEQKVYEGSRVDTIWEAAIGNMGRVIYVFEVQAKGSIDGLCMNLLKVLNNPAVQGIVAVSDKDQIEKIKNHVKPIKDLKDKLKYWDYVDVLAVHQSLESTYEIINKLELVPQSFL